MKNTDCLCRKVLVVVLEHIVPVACCVFMFLAGYLMGTTFDKKTTMNVDVLNKEGKSIWTQSIQQKRAGDTIELSAPLRTIDTGWFGVGNIEIKNADRVVVRVK